MIESEEKATLRHLTTHCEPENVTIILRTRSKGYWLSADCLGDSSILLRGDNDTILQWWTEEEFEQISTESRHS